MIPKGDWEPLPPKDGFLVDRKMLPISLTLLLLYDNICVVRCRQVRGSAFRRMMGKPHNKELAYG